MLPVAVSAVPVASAVPLRGATAAERLAHAQARADELDALVDEKMQLLGEEGIRRPKDALLFVNGLVFKEGTQQLTCNCMFCNTRITSTGAARVVDHLIACILSPKAVQQSFSDMRSVTSKKRKVKEEHTRLVNEQAAARRCRRRSWRRPCSGRPLSGRASVRLRVMLLTTRWLVSSTRTA